MIKVKSFLERNFLRDLNQQFRNKRTFMKKAVLQTTTLMHCKAWQILRDLFITNQGNGSEMRFVAVATKFNLKNLKS